MTYKLSGDTSSFFYNQKLVYGHFSHLRNSYAQEGPVQVHICAASAEYTRGQLYIYIYIYMCVCVCVCVCVCARAHKAVQLKTKLEHNGT
jgi:hypothetical protein